MVDAYCELLDEWGAKTGELIITFEEVQSAQQLQL